MKMLIILVIVAAVAVGIAYLSGCLDKVLPPEM